MGVVLANEVLDALPVHRVRQRGDELRELAVDVDPADGHLVETEIAPTTPALAARLDGEGIALVDGQTAEICLAIDGWLAARDAPTCERGLVAAHRLRRPGRRAVRPAPAHGTGRCAPTCAIASTTIRTSTSAART